MALSTIQILSSQYEISSQLSPQLGLRGLIETFSNTVIRRYALKNVHVFLSEYKSEPLENAIEFHQNYAVFSHNTVKLANGFHALMIEKYTALKDDQSYLKDTFDEASHHYLIIKLGALGFIILETNDRELDKSQVHSLISIMKILCEHITACIEKEALRRSHDKIYKQLYFDELTGLPNRTGLFKAMNDCDVQVHQKMSAVLFNIKEFGLINHQYGYPAGDKILQRIAAELESEFGQSRAYRIGPDEFLTLHKKINEHETHDAFEMKITKVKSAVRKKTLEEDNIFVDMWSCASHNSKGEEKSFQTLNAIKFAMSTLRAKRGALHLIIDDNTHEQFKIDHMIHGILAHELPFEQFKTVFQPQYDITGKIIAAEALIRWEHPKLGNISPDKFIPILESNQKIVDLDRFVLEQSLVAMSTLKKLYPEPPKLAINVSGHSFVSDVFYKDVIESLNAQSNIVLELTETAKIFELEHISPAFSEFTKRGIEIHLDDFGTGYSSISYLLSLQFGMLKIDKCFISNIESDKTKQRIVKSIVSLAKSCDLDVLVEGVETQSEFKTCVSLGVSKFQGYYFARPLRLSELITRINAQNDLKASAHNGHALKSA